MTSANLEHWPVTKPIPYARNARVCPEQAIAKVAGSIHEFGFRSPILVDEGGVIIAGHTRLAAAVRLGLETVPVIVCRGLTTAQVKAYRLADNRTAQETTWDDELLAVELEELLGLDVDLAPTGFDPGEIDRLTGDGALGSVDAGFEPGDGLPYDEQYGVIVVCGSEDEQRRAYERLLELGYQCRVVTV